MGFCPFVLRGRTQGLWLWVSHRCERGGEFCPSFPYPSPNSFHNNGGALPFLLVFSLGVGSSEVASWSNVVTVGAGGGSMILPNGVLLGDPYSLSNPFFGPILDVEWGAFWKLAQWRGSFGVFGNKEGKVCQEEVSGGRE